MEIDQSKKVSFHYVIKACLLFLDYAKFIKGTDAQFIKGTDALFHIANAHIA